MEAGVAFQRKASHFLNTPKGQKMEQPITKVIVISTYFGSWPVWFPAFLVSCAKNETIDWLFFTDCEIPKATYPNIRFEQMDLGEFNRLASKQLGFRIQKGVYAQVDLQPAYGVIFEEYIKGFDFWGHCDVDVVWGDIRSFITEALLRNHDIVACRKDFLAGHLTLWRNEPQTNGLFRLIPAYREIFSCSEYHNFDESIASTFLKTLIATGNSKIRVYWPEQMVVWFYGEANPNGWYWCNGKIFDARHRERIYLHFQASKNWVTRIDFDVSDRPAKFDFTRHGIWSRRPFVRDLPNAKVKWIGLIRSISKFLGRTPAFLRLLKRVLLVRNIYWAQRLATNSISASDVQYEWRTERLRLKRLNLQVGKREQFLLEGYHAALRLVDQLSARFYNDEGELFIDVAGLRVFIGSAKEILRLKELLVDGIYNMLPSRPTVVLDIGMNVGLSSLCFASQPGVVVVGFEPCETQYDQALRNISLNPKISDRIRTFKVGIGDSKFKSIAVHPPERTSRPGLLAPSSDYGVGPRFEYEEIEIEDVANILNSIVADYPGRDVVVKIDFESSGYHIDGISEYHLINRLQTAGGLDLIDTILLKWHKSKPELQPPLIARQLGDYGFNVFLFAPCHPHEGLLYAVRGSCPKASPSQQ